MKKLIGFILFLIICIVIFFISNYNILNLILIILLLLAFFITKININKVIKYNLSLFPFIFFVGIINGLLISINDGLLGIYRLILVCNITYLYSNKLTVMQFSKIIEKLFYPLKIFKINSKDIGMIVAIGLTFIPILKEELTQIKNALKIKGMKINIKNVKYILKIVLESTIKRIDELEIALKIKCYE